MARRRQEDSVPTRFTTGEVAAATGMPVRSVIYLCDQKLLPSEGGGSLNTHREIGLEGLIRAAITSTIFSTGIDIAKAARVVEALVDDPDVGSKIARAGLDHLARKHASAEGSSQIVVPEETLWSDEPIFWHASLWKTSNYNENQASPYDHLLEIIDGKWVFINHLSVKDENLSPSANRFYMFEIKNIEKSAKNMSIIQGPTSSSPVKLTWDKRKVVVSLNLSLSARNALDAIANMRN